MIAKGTMSYKDVFMVLAVLVDKSVDGAHSNLQNITYGYIAYYFKQYILCHDEDKALEYLKRCATTNDCHIDYPILLAKVLKDNNI